jgi:hypothetical protein
MRCPCCESELPEALIMSAAARIAVGRRKVHKGAEPKTFACEWCSAKCVGRVALEKHQRDCEKRPEGLVEVTPEDMRALAWSPEAT